MKILHITNYMYPHIGGIEQTTRDIIGALQDIEEQSVICFNHEKGDVRDSVDGVEIMRCSVAVKISSQAISLSFKKNLKKELKRLNPDLVIFHYPNPFEAHYLLKCLKKYPKCRLLVWWHLDITKQKFLGKIFKGQTKRLLRRADKVVTTSQELARKSPFLSHIPEKCVVIPSCINEKRLQIDDEDTALSGRIKEGIKGKTMCFAVGRHVEYKGLRYLIEASRYLDDNFRIFIGGSGPLTASLKKLAKGDDKIIFIGKISDKELKAYLLACDIYCFPSITKNEAFGLALAEAMYFSKPAVTFTIEGSGVNFVSPDGVTGIEVENGNSEKYAEAIKKLAENSALREQYGVAARKRVGELFLQDTFSRKVAGLIRSVAEKTDNDEHCG